MANINHTISALAFASLAFTTAPAVADSQPAPETQFETVCASAFVKSPNLLAACAADATPETVKDGSRFKHQGVGAEVNILAANLHLVRQ